MQDRLNMRPSLPPFKLWRDPQPIVTMKLWFWNVTNPQEFLSGVDDKLKIKEVGPIVYREILKHRNVTFHDNSTMSYTAVNQVVLLEDQNEPGILNKTFITPNLATLVSNG